jgi:pSer/pThr/pTyr-binding forkhead associated (FHA) protein
MPSPGLPAVVGLTARSLLIGRVSPSRNIHPDIDCTTDTGVSRRHAQLTTDGQRWFVEDLGSSNGTFVGPASGPLPEDPIAVGPRTELDDDDRIYVGAWTRIVVRAATDEEKAAPTA